MNNQAHSAHLSRGDTQSSGRSGLIETDLPVIQNDRRQSYVSPRNNNSTQMFNAIRFTPRSPTYDQFQTINPTSQRTEPIMVKSTDRFSSHLGSPVSEIGKPQPFYSRNQSSIGIVSPPLTEMENSRQTVPFYRDMTGNDNPSVISQENLQIRHFSPLDSHTSSTNRDMNATVDDIRYSDQFNQYNSIGNEQSNYESPIDRESNLRFLEDEDVDEIDDTIGRLESVVNMLRNSSEDAQLLERLDRLERNVLTTLVVTNMMGINGIKSNAKSEIFRSIENLSNYVHSDLLAKSSFRKSMSQGLTATRDSLVSVIEIKFNESCKNMETRLSLEDFTVSNSQLKEYITTEIQGISNDTTLDSNLVGQITESIQKSVQDMIQNKSEDSITLELIRTEMGSVVDKITTTINQKTISRDAEYKRFEQSVATIIMNQLHPITELIKLETNKTNLSIKTLSQSVRSLHDQVVEINNTHSKHIRIINNNITELGRVTTSIKNELKKFNSERRGTIAISDTTNSRSRHSNIPVESRRSRRKKSQTKSVTGNPSALPPNSIHSSSVASKHNHESATSRPPTSNSQGLKINTFKSIISPPMVVPSTTSHYNKVLPKYPPSNSHPTMISPVYSPKSIPTVISPHNLPKSVPTVISPHNLPKSVPVVISPRNLPKSVPVVISPHNSSQPHPPIVSSLIYSPSTPFSSVVSPVTFHHSNKPASNMYLSIAPHQKLPKTTLPPARATRITHNSRPPPVRSTPKTIKNETVRPPIYPNPKMPTKNQVVTQSGHSTISNKTAIRNIQNDVSSESETQLNSENSERKPSGIEPINLSPPFDTNISQPSEVTFVTSSSSNLLGNSTGSFSDKDKSTHNKKLHPKEIENIKYEEEKSENVKSDPELDRKFKNKSSDSELADEILTRSFSDI